MASEKSLKSATTDSPLSMDFLQPGNEWLFLCGSANPLAGMEEASNTHQETILRFLDDPTFVVELLECNVYVVFHSHSVAQWIILQLPKKKRNGSVCADQN